jgi:hypothetical protein
MEERMTLRRRLDRLEQLVVPAFVLAETIDRPPQETKEQWLARQAGNPDRSPVNARGETREQWFARRETELHHQLGLQER